MLRHVLREVTLHKACVLLFDGSESSKLGQYGDCTRVRLNKAPSHESEDVEA
jgi:hypothetical protein